MKKFLAFIVSLTIAISQLSIISVAIDNGTNNISLNDFTTDFVQMVNDDNSDFHLEGNAALYAAGVINEGQTEIASEESVCTNRLIVKSSRVLDERDSIGYVYGYNDLHILQFSSKQAMLSAKEYYSSLPYVEYAEEDYILKEAVTDDGVVFESSADYPTAVQSNLFGYTTAKKNSSGGSSVKIAVIDSGVQTDHEFLVGRVVDSGFNSISDNGTAYDDRGHGTHVAGIIVANTLSNVKVYAYKALNASGSGTSAQIVLAIDAAIEDGVDIINLSMSMKGTSTTLKEAVLRAYNAGICVIVAAGNAGVDLTGSPYSPGCFEEAISVMSCSDSRRILSTSNYGTPCDFAAPGENILSTYIGNTYKLSTGTSMAAPFICAAASYVLGKNPSYTPDEVCLALSERTEWCYGSPTGKCVYPATKTTVAGKTATPEFELDSCSFLGKMKVSLSCSTANSEIFYTVTGDITYKSYTEPFYIDETTSFSAFAVSEGMYNSATKTVTYTLMDGNVSDFTVDENNVLVGYSGSDTVISVPSYINGRRVAGLSANAFSGNKNVISVSFEKSLTTITEGAFVGCTALSSIYAPGVATIEKDAFNSCKALNTVSCSSLENVGENAFYGCTSLFSVTDDKIVNVDAGAFANTVSLTSFSSTVVNKIGNNAFEGSGVSELGIANAAQIGDYAFRNCNALTQICISNATSVGTGAFSGCASATTAVLPLLVAIPEECFSGCSKLSIVTASVAETVNSYAFKDCSALKDLGGFSVLKKVCSYAFDGAGLTKVNSNVIDIVEEFAFNNCKKLTSFSLSRIASFDLNVLEGATALQSISLLGATNIIFPEEGIATICPALKSFQGGNITSIPENAFKDCTALSSVTCTYVKSIGKNAFNNTALTELDFPELYAVSEGSFANIPALKSVTLTGVKEIYVDTFLNCNAVTSVNLNGNTKIPEGISFNACFPNLKTFKSSYAEVIPAYAFSGCEYLSSITINKVHTIGEGAFKDCALSDVIIYASSIGKNAFDGNPLKIIDFYNLETYEHDIFGSSKATVEEIYMDDMTDLGNISFSDFDSLSVIELDIIDVIPSGCFKNVTTLTSVFAPDATKIESEAFYNCTSLQSVVFDNLKTIAERAFYNCKAFTSFESDSIEEIDLGIFEGCTNLTNISLNSLVSVSNSDIVGVFSGLDSLQQFSADSLTAVPANAFDGCESLTTVSFASATNIGRFAFRNTSLAKYTFGKVISIGDYAFANTAITEASFSFVTNMGYGVFSGCTSLTKANLPLMTQVPDYTFKGDSLLGSVTLGNVARFGKYAFYDCVKLSLITCRGIAQADDYAFYNCRGLNPFSKLNLKGLGEYSIYSTRTSSTLTLPYLEDIEKNAFEGVTIKQLVLENVVNVYDIPDNCIVLIGKDVENGAISKVTGSTIYAPADSLVADYCIANGLKYIEFNETNPIMTNTQEKITGYDQYLSFEALGFNLSYSWYGCNKEDCSDAVLLDSGNTAYKPIGRYDSSYNDEGDYKYYYCIARSFENGNVVNIKSKLVRNTFAYIRSFSDKTTIEYDIGYIYSNELNSEELVKNISLEEGCYKVTPSYSCGNVVSYGTGSVIDIYDDGEMLFSYTLILDGDVNGDGYVDALDCHIVGLAQKNLVEIEDENYSMAAAWFDGSDGVSAQDYQAVVNKALS